MKIKAMIFEARGQIHCIGAASLLSAESIRKLEDQMTDERRNVEDAARTLRAAGHDAIAEETFAAARSFRLVDAELTILEPDEEKLTPEKIRAVMDKMGERGITQ